MIIRKLLKKVGILPILEISPILNSHLIEMILIKIWVQYDLDSREKRGDILEIKMDEKIITHHKKEISQMNIYDFSNTNINKNILLKYEGKENELILLLILEFLCDLFLYNNAKKMDISHLSHDFKRFEL